MRFPEHGPIGAFCGVFRRVKRVIGALFGVILIHVPSHQKSASPGYQMKGTSGNGSVCNIPETREIIGEELFFITEPQNNPAIMVKAGISAHKEPRVKGVAIRKV